MLAQLVRIVQIMPNAIKSACNGSYGIEKSIPQPNGKAAGDQPSYAVYMKEGDPDYGKVFHVGDTLPDGNKFNGTMKEYTDNMGNEIIKEAQKQGYDVEEKDDSYVIHID